MRAGILRLATAAFLMWPCVSAAQGPVVGRFARAKVELATCDGQSDKAETLAPNGSVTFAVNCLGVVSRVTLALDLPSATPALQDPSLSFSRFVTPLRVGLTQTVTWTSPTTPGAPPKPYFLDLGVSGPSGCSDFQKNPDLAAGTHTRQQRLACDDPDTQRLGAGESEAGSFGGGFSATYTASVNFTVRYYYVYQAQGADLQVTVDAPAEVVGASAPFQIHVRNAGPETAQSPLLTLYYFGAGTLSGTTCLEKVTSPLTTCRFAPLPAGGTAEFTFALSPYDNDRLFPLNLQAAVSSATADPAGLNNTANATVFYSPDCGNDLLSCAFAAFSIPACRDGRPSPLAVVSSIFVDLASLYRLRDEVFARSPAGRRYTQLFYGYSPEVARLLLTDASFRAVFGNGLEAWRENVKALVEGRGASAVLTQAQVDALLAVLQRLETQGSPELRAVIAREKALLDLPSLVGKTMSAALARQQGTAPASVTIPAAASIHGVGSSFFHSDLRVFNPSASATVAVVARYRCFAGPCPTSAEKTFSVRPREMAVHDDVIAGLFGAPETAGAVELTGEVLAESRVYTPSRPAPTTGADVPGLSSDEAYVESLLTSLSRSADGSRGFRTNAGAYNPNDQEVGFTISLFRAGGTPLGQVSRTLPARSATQVNDVFAAAGVSEDVADGYALVKSEGGRPLFAYATVIDNQSQDSVFVKGRSAAGTEPFALTIPAAASIHGVGTSFFHSDLRLFNPAPVAGQVLATYRCFTGPCPEPAMKTIPVGPREMKVLDDAVAGLFGAPETAGAVELAGNVAADSRVYTPSRPDPTTGTGVPGLAAVEATTEAVLLALSHSADRSVGSRTNVGIFNPDFRDHEIAISLRRPDGTELARLTRSVPAKTSVQVNDVFGAAGVASDVPAAYALVSGDGSRAFFAYATVIDNQSQDPVFVKGRALRP